MRRSTAHVSYVLLILTQEDDVRLEKTISPLYCLLSMVSIVTCVYALKDGVDCELKAAEIRFGLELEAPAWLRSHLICGSFCR